MSTTTETGATPPTVAVDKEDPWRYGWRYVLQAGPGGTGDYKQVPLTQEDLLYPQEDDFIVNNPVHEEICTYLRGAMFDHFAGRAGAVVLHDCRVDCGAAGVQPLGPDFSVFDGVHVPWERSRGTFHVADVGARPLLAVEVTSPTTRKVDLYDKVDLYFRAAIPFYAIVDPRSRPDGSLDIRLLGYRRDAANRQAYAVVQVDDPARLWLETIRLWFASEGGTVVCHDESGRRLMAHLEAVQAARHAQEQAETAEARVRELEAELQRLRGEAKGGPPNPAAP